MKVASNGEIQDCNAIQEASPALSEQSLTGSDQTPSESDQTPSVDSPFLTPQEATPSESAVCYYAETPVAVPALGPLGALGLAALLGAAGYRRLKKA